MDVLQQKHQDISLNTKINWLHERCFRIIYNGKNSNSNELLVTDGSVSVQHKNLQKLAVKGLSAKILMNYFNSESKYLMN